MTYMQWTHRFLTKKYPLDVFLNHTPSGIYLLKVQNINAVT